MKSLSQKERSKTSESRAAIAKHVLASRKKGGKFKTYIAACRVGKDEEFTSWGDHIVKDIRDSIKAYKTESDFPIDLEKMLRICKKTKILVFIKPLSDLICWKKFWIRRPETWKPKSKNPERQFASFTRHLLVKYDVPEFMDKAWGEYTANRHHQEWFVNLGQGENIRKQNNLPFPLTKKMAHLFLSAPSTCTIPMAFRWAHIHSIGGDKRIFDGIMTTNYADNFLDHKFWESVFKFFIDNPLLDIAQYSPICDYIENRKFHNRGYEYVDGVRVRIGPLQPNFSMSGRNPETLLREVDHWHNELGRRGARNGPVNWSSCGISGFERKQKDDKGVYSITEILTAKGLASEGRAMRNCVSSYAYSCGEGRSSIYSLKNIKKDGTVTHMATIQVDLASQTICQARAKANEFLSARSTNIMKLWCTETGLKISSYL